MTVCSYLPSLDNHTSNSVKLLTQRRTKKGNITGTTKIRETRMAIIRTEITRSDREVAGDTTIVGAEEASVAIEKVVGNVEVAVDVVKATNQETKQLVVKEPQKKTSNRMKKTVKMVEERDVSREEAVGEAAEAREAEAVDNRIIETLGIDNMMKKRKDMRRKPSKLQELVLEKKTTLLVKYETWDPKMAKDKMTTTVGVEVETIVEVAATIRIVVIMATIMTIMVWKHQEQLERASKGTRRSSSTRKREPTKLRAATRDTDPNTRTSIKRVERKSTTRARTEAMHPKASNRKSDTRTRMLEA